MPVWFDRTHYAVQSAKRALLVAAVIAATIQFDLSPVLHGAAAHLDEASDRGAFEPMPAIEFTGSLGGAVPGRVSPATEPEVKHRIGYVEFED